MVIKSCLALGPWAIQVSAGFVEEGGERCR